MDDTPKRRPGRPRKSFQERLHDLLATATPEDHQLLEDYAKSALRAQGAPGELDLPDDQGEPSPKLSSLLSLCDSALRRKLSRVTGDWRVRCWVYEPDHPDANPKELDRFGEPTELSGCYKLSDALPVLSCEPDVLGQMRSLGARGRATFEFLSAHEEPLQVTVNLSAEIARPKPASAGGGQGQALMAEALGRMMEMIAKQNEQTQAMIAQALAQRAPRNTEFDAAAAEERLERMRERMLAEVEASKRNDPAFALSRDLLSTIVQGGLNRVKANILGEASPAAPTGVGGAAPSTPTSPIRQLAEVRRQAMEDLKVAREVLPELGGPPPEPSLLEQAQALVAVAMQAYGLYQSFKQGGPSGLLQMTQGLNALAGGPSPVTPGAGDALLKDLGAKAVG